MELALPYRATDSGYLVLMAAFIEPAIREGLSADEPSDEHGVTPQERPSLGLFSTVAAPGNRKLMLLGDPDSGKSTTIRYLALSLARNQGEESSSGMGRFHGVMRRKHRYQGSARLN